MESSICIENEIAILLFFIHFVILWYTVILYEILPSLLTGVF